LQLFFSYLILSPKYTPTRAQTPKTVDTNQSLHYHFSTQPICLDLLIPFFHYCQSRLQSPLFLGPKAH